MTSATVYTHVLFSIFLAGTDMFAAQGISSLISQLFNSQSQNNKPLVIVLNRNNVREEQKYPVKPNNLAGANLDTEEEIPQGVYLIKSQLRPSAPSPKLLPPVNRPGSPSGLSELFDLLANRPRAKAYKGQLTGLGKTSIQKLLRQSDCDATDACIDKCKNRFKGKKRKTCKVKCEVTFDCPPTPEEPEDYDDPCEDNYNDEGCFRK